MGKNFSKQFLERRTTSEYKNLGKNTTEKHKTKTNNRKQKFAPENLFQTATLRKGDLTWGTFSQNSFWSDAPHPNTKT